MDGNSAQKDWLAVQQDVVALHFDGPEPDRVFEVIVAGADFDVIQLRRLRRPALQIRCLERNRGTPLRINGSSLREIQLRNLHRDLRSRVGANHVYPPGDRGVRRFLQLQRIVIDKRFRRLDQRHVTRQPAVVPPVGVQRRHAVALALVVDMDHHEVVAIVKQAGDLAVERREPSFVVAGFLAIHERASQIVGGTDVKKSPGTGLALILEVLLVPDRAFVEEQRVALRVPIAGNFQRRRLREVVLHQFVAGPRLLVKKVAIGTCLHAEVEISVVVGIDDRVPVAIETDGRPMVRIDQQGWLAVGRRRKARQN